MLWESCQSPVAHSCSLLNHPNSFCRGMFKLNAKFDAYSLLYLLSHFECDGHTVHMLTQWRLPPPRSITMKLSLFMHVHSSLLSLAASLHECHANHSHYITNGWTFPGQSLWFSFFILFMWCIMLTNLQILKQLCILGTNPTWLWYIIFFMYCWIWFANILLRICFCAHYEC